MNLSADSTTPVTGSYSGSSFVVSRDTSIFGAGWSPKGVDNLVDIPADGLIPTGKLRVYGSSLWSFQEGTGTFTSPACGGWLYTGATGQRPRFDSGGKQARLVSADGLSTTMFTYPTGICPASKLPTGR